MRNAEGGGGLEVGGDAGLPNLGLDLVGQGEDDQVGLLDGIGHGHRVEAVLDGELAVGRVTAVGDDDLDAGVAEVEAVGVALAAEAEDGHRLALERVQGGVLLVHHLQRLGHGGAPFGGKGPG